MQRSTNWGRHLPEVFAPDERANADTYVYCKGCGQPLEGHARRMPGRAPVTVMMCSPCQERHGHELIPKSGEPSFCYRCGGPDELFVSDGFSPVTYRICPRCVPDRAARYRSGDYGQPPRPEETAKAD